MVTALSSVHIFQSCCITAVSLKHPHYLVYKLCTHPFLCSISAISNNILILIFLHTNCAHIHSSAASLPSVITFSSPCIQTVHTSIPLQHPCLQS